MAGALVKTLTESFLDPVYLKFRQEIAGILDQRTHTIEWLDGQVWSGRAQIWGDERACLLTEIRYFPTGAFEVHVLVAAGDLNALIDEIIVEVEHWAGQLGALFVTIASRKGWEKIMKPRGYQFWQSELRRDV